MDRVVDKDTFDTEYPDPAVTDEDFKIQPYLEHCESSHNFMWLGRLIYYR
jgi:hypothetical protein